MQLLIVEDEIILASKFKDYLSPLYDHIDSTGGFYEAKEKRIGEATERVRRHKQCFLDLKRIRGNLVEKMRRWNI